MNRRWYNLAETFVHLLLLAYPWNDHFCSYRLCQDNRSGNLPELLQNRQSRWLRSGWCLEQHGGASHSNAGWPVRYDVNTACREYYHRLRVHLHQPGSTVSLRHTTPPCGEAVSLTTAWRNHGLLTLVHQANTGMLPCMSMRDMSIWESLQNCCSCISEDSRSFDLHSGFV